MSSLASAAIAPDVVQSERVLADNLYWLSKLDQNLPRAHVIPDFKRSSSARHQYREIAFSLDPEVVRVLKSLDTTRGVPDLVLCATLLTVLLAKYHREDELVVGLLGNGPAAGDRSVVPLRLSCAPDDTAP